MQTLEYHGSKVFLCYTHAPSEVKVSLTENVNINACGGELDGLYTFPLQRTIKDFSAFTLKHDAAKNSIGACRIDYPLNINLLFTYGLKFELSLTFVTVTELITVPFGETNQIPCALYFFYSTS